MTRDFLDDFSEAAEREGIPFVVLTVARCGDDTSVRASLRSWRLPGTGRTREYEALRALAAGLSLSGAVEFRVMPEEKFRELVGLVGEHKALELCDSLPA